VAKVGPKLDGVQPGLGSIGDTPDPPCFCMRNGFADTPDCCAALAPAFALAVHGGVMRTGKT
jgi:hypothetical protein